MQPLTEVLLKRLFSGSVHAGTRLFKPWVDTGFNLDRSYNALNPSLEHIFCFIPGQSLNKSL